MDNDVQHCVPVRKGAVLPSVAGLDGTRPPTRRTLCSGTHQNFTRKTLTRCLKGGNSCETIRFMEGATERDAALFTTLTLRLAQGSTPIEHLFRQVSRMVVLAFFAGACTLRCAYWTSASSTTNAPSTSKGPLRGPDQVWRMPDLSKPDHESDCSADWIRVLLSMHSPAR